MKKNRKTNTRTKDDRKNSPFEDRKRFCPFSQKNSPKIDYKDLKLLTRFLTEKGKKLILSRENEFCFLMLIFGQVRLLQLISRELEFKLNTSISKIRDKFFDL